MMNLSTETGQLQNLISGNALDKVALDLPRPNPGFSRLDKTANVVD